MSNIKLSTKITLLSLTLLVGQSSFAQLSTNPDKFLGNITTGWGNDMDTNGLTFWKLWNQVTPENASKWASVEGNKGSFSFGGADKAFNYAKKNNFTYKFHTLVWGSQYPSWLEKLSATERYGRVIKWFDAVKKKYNTLPMIDVVNEAVGTHQKGNPMMKETMGGGGKTGYDWLIKAFEMAYERWPDAILIYNDFNTFQWNTNEYIELVRYLRDAGAPIDAYGCQSHDVDDITENSLKNAMKKIQDALKMPMYITELDIGIENDTKQKNQYEKIFPLMWEADYCAGITLWGFINGSTWRSNTGLYRKSTPRPSMEWLIGYMASDAAKNVKSPFPGMKKEASVYISPGAMKVARGDVLPIRVRATMATKTIEKIDLYTADKLIATLTGDPSLTEYLTEYTVPASSTNGWKELKAIVTATDGSTYERLSRFYVLSSSTLREPYNGVVPELPGTINVEEFDKGAEGASYSKASRSSATATQTGGWMEFTVDVKQEGKYTFDVELAATKTGGAFHLSEYSFNCPTYLSDFIQVPKTGSNKSDFQTKSYEMRETLTAGRHVLCLNIENGGFYIKSITFRLKGQSGINQIKTDGQAGDSYNLSGQKVNANYHGIVIRNGKKVHIK